MAFKKVPKFFTQHLKPYDLQRNSPGNLFRPAVSNARRTRATSHPCERGAGLLEDKSNPQEVGVAKFSSGLQRASQRAVVGARFSLPAASRRVPLWLVRCRTTAKPRRKKSKIPGNSRNVEVRDAAQFSNCF